MEQLQQTRKWLLSYMQPWHMPLSKQDKISKLFSGHPKPEASSLTRPPESLANSKGIAQMQATPGKGIDGIPALQVPARTCRGVPQQTIVPRILEMAAKEVRKDVFKGSLLVI